jgi:DNA-binding XRE family transcriptional regulator
MTQVKLADLWGLSRTTVVNIERGRQRVSVHQLVLLADHLGCTTEDLIPTSSERGLLSPGLLNMAPDDRAVSFVSEISAARRKPS